MTALQPHPTDRAASPHPEAALAHLDSLPTLPEAALRLLHATSDPDAGARELVAHLARDQSLAAKVLSVASSVAGTGRTIRTLEQAVPLLGFAAVRSIVLATSVFECFRGAGGPRPAGGFDRCGFWTHSLAVACAARGLARLRPARDVDPEAAYLAGLLHDIGKVALDAVFPKAYDRISQRAVAERADIADLERELLGVDHTRAGRRLAERWKLPAELRDVIWLHHLATEALPTTVRAPNLIALIHLADTLVREQRIGFSGNLRFFEHSPRLGVGLGFSIEQLDALATTLVREAAEQTAQLGLDRPAPEKLYVQAMGQANAELGRINTELSATNQRLAAAARYFNAICVLDQRVGASADLPTVVAGLVAAAETAFQRRSVAAFGVRGQNEGIELAWRSGGAETERSVAVEPLPLDFAEWLNHPESCATSLLVKTPSAARRALAQTELVRSFNPEWLIPIIDQQRLIGGMLVAADSAGAAPFDAYSPDARALLQSLGLALSRANARQAAVRLTDDLADTNRRMQQMQAELLRSRTLSMIAEMAAGAAHELNSPLTVISGRAQMLAQRTSDPEGQRALDMIQDKAHECSRIVTELMDFARPRPPQFAPLDLVDLLQEMRAAFLKDAGWTTGRVLVHCEGLDAFRPVGGSAPRAMLFGDRALLRSVLGELLDNARHALTESPDGTIGLSVRPAVAMDGFEVRVADTGVGMPPDVQERAFDPFFSHRPAGRRRGLGLAKAYRIIESHHGRIWLESTLGVGTTVHIVLPRRGE